MFTPFDWFGLGVNELQRFYSLGNKILQCAQLHNMTALERKPG